MGHGGEHALIVVVHTASKADVEYEELIQEEFAQQDGEVEEPRVQVEEVVVDREFDHDRAAEAFQPGRERIPAPRE